MKEWGITPLSAENAKTKHENRGKFTCFDDFAYRHAAASFIRYLDLFKIK